jgi:hypothetical protein
MTSGAIRLEMADRTMTGSDDPFRLGNHEPAKIATAAGLRAHEITSIIGFRLFNFPDHHSPQEWRERTRFDDLFTRLP